MSTSRLEDDAQLLGIDSSELVRLRYEYPPGAFASEMLANEYGVARLKEWIAVGRPEGVIARLLARGDSSVEATLHATIERLPAPARHFAIGEVAWFVLPHGADGVHLRAIPRTLRPMHVVLLWAGIEAARLPAVITHELGHAWLAPPFDEREDARPKRSPGWLERVCVDEVDDGVRELVDIRHEKELQADALARVWGFPIQSCGDWRRRLIEQEIREGADRFAAAACPATEE